MAHTALANTGPCGTNRSTRALAGAAIQITAGYVNGQDTLAFVNQGAITGTWDAATGRARLLVDGVAVDSSLSTTPVAEFLGHDPRLFLGANFIGTLDEARLADRARPPAWFRLEHRTQVPGSTALRFHHPP